MIDQMLLYGREDNHQEDTMSFFSRAYVISLAHLCFSFRCYHIIKILDAILKAF